LAARRKNRARTNYSDQRRARRLGCGGAKRRRSREEKNSRHRRGRLECEVDDFPLGKQKFKSGPDLTPREMVAQMKPLLQDWSFDAVSMGFPAPVRNGRIMSEPKHLGPGWTRFNFEKALGKPIRIINDAAMQALGSFHGGRMLFLGLGTGLGSTLIWETNVLPLELGDLPYGSGDTIEDYLGKSGMNSSVKKNGNEKSFARCCC